ncbi:hypothetical protein [Deinococcus misasensis]|uniref:hypothetical protein n=1 Tax=Deinococcus misasensis TaxID=392413 RepID=UPI0005506C64|nr:hypothetical protein [Deinococcus misasensis]
MSVKTTGVNRPPHLEIKVDESGGGTIFLGGVELPWVKSLKLSMDAETQTNSVFMQVIVGQVTVSVPPDLLTVGFLPADQLEEPTEA